MFFTFSFLKAQISINYKYGIIATGKSFKANKVLFKYLSSTLTKNLECKMKAQY